MSCVWNNPLWSSKVRTAVIFAVWPMDEAGSCPQLDLKPGGTVLLLGFFPSIPRTEDTNLIFHSPHRNASCWNVLKYRPHVGTIDDHETPWANHGPWTPSRRLGGRFWTWISFGLSGFLGQMQISKWFSFRPTFRQCLSYLQICNRMPLRSYIFI